MKRVVSVSLGSATGDFEREILVGSERVHLTREGMDGDIERARARLIELDGHVDALGLGGIDISLSVGGKKFIIGDGQRLAEAATKTPVVDGSGLKETLEQETIHELVHQGWIHEGTSVLMVSAMDRFGMAEALVQAGCQCIFGDLIFTMGFDYPLTTLADLEELAQKYRSRLLTVPFHLLYPTGEKQTQRTPDPRFQKYYDAAEIIAGDRYLIHRHLPDRIPGKGIITNTTRPSTIEAFRTAGAQWVATTTPEMDGVSGGTNLMEAALVAVMGKPVTEITPEEYRTWIQNLGWHGSFQRLEGNRKE
jgi:hypothetical protein